MRKRASFVHRCGSRCCSVRGDPQAPCSRDRPEETERPCPAAKLWVRPERPLLNGGSLGLARARRRTGGIDGRPGGGTQKRATPRSSAWASRISISITCTGSIRMCRSKRRSAPWPTWCAPERSAIWACRKPAPPPSGARTRFIRSPLCRSEYSLWSRDPEDEILPTLAESLVSASWPISPLGRGFLAGRFKSIDDLAPDDWRRFIAAFPGGEFRQEPGPGRPGERARPGARAALRRSSRSPGCWREARCRADPRHQQRCTA